MINDSDAIRRQRKHFWECWTLATGAGHIGPIPVVGHTVTGSLLCHDFNELSDLDVLVLVTDRQVFEEEVEQFGFSTGTADHYSDDGFTCFKIRSEAARLKAPSGWEHFNFIVTDVPGLYSKWQLCMDFCARYGLPKHERGPFFEKWLHYEEVEQCQPSTKPSE